MDDSQIKCIWPWASGCVHNKLRYGHHFDGSISFNFALGSCAFVCVYSTVFGVFAMATRNNMEDDSVGRIYHMVSYNGMNCTLFFFFFWSFILTLTIGMRCNQIFRLMIGMLSVKSSMRIF